MQNILFIVGDKLRYSKDFLDYLERQILKKITKLDATVFLKENNPNILVEFESYIKKAENIIIAASKTTFPLMAKMLSTHMQDQVVVKDNLLVPSKAKTVAPNSYLVEIKNKTVNVLRVDTDEVIPEILLEEQLKSQRAFVLDEDENGIRVLATPIAKACDIGLNVYKNQAGFVEITAEERKYGKIDSFFASISKLFSGKVIVADSLQEYIVDVFGASKYKLAIAESCTGGLTSYKITSVPGASQMLFGSVATYSNDAKTLWLGVEEDKIDEYGAVSEETVSGMLEGVLKVSGADFAIAISGIAGPDGGTKDKPVGTVYAGVRHKDGESKIFKKQFYGDRTLIQSASADFALKNLCEFLKYFPKTS